MNNNTTTNKMNIFAEMLAIGGTVYSKSEARIKADKVGGENFKKWTKLMGQAHIDFYEYKRMVDNTLKGIDCDLKTAENNAFASLQEIIDTIGHINGFKLEKSAELLAEVAKYAVAEKTDLAGDALMYNSQLKNYNTELKLAGYNEDTKTFNNGVNPNYIKELVEKRDLVKDKLAAAKKLPDSGKTGSKMTSYTSFCANFERKLANLSERQAMKSYEEIKAEREAEKAAKRAAKKAAKAK